MVRQPVSARRALLVPFVCSVSDPAAVNVHPCISTDRHWLWLTGATRLPWLFSTIVFVNMRLHVINTIQNCIYQLWHPGVKLRRRDGLSKIGKDLGVRISAQDWDVRSPQDLPLPKNDAGSGRFLSGTTGLPRFSVSFISDGLIKSIPYLSVWECCLKAESTTKPLRMVSVRTVDNQSNPLREMSPRRLID